ncbi:MAG: response regulator transcription factor [Flavipsychrobacter sp.]|jgi:DNA-binding LytR/AlgR family response regulator|nr:response regulator transcription factor [Flavipsychrobacter sp.]
MKITCLITDDEPIARAGLRNYIEKIDFLTLLAECEDAVSLNNQLHQQPVDLVFLDIEMPYISGIDLLQSLAHPPKVIFTTAYEQYAIKGYELDVLDYLLKPISFDRFLKSANKARDYFYKNETSSGSDEFFIKSDGKYLKLQWNEILLLEGMENYICIHTSTQKHLVHMTMKQVLEQLPDQFIQVHKSSIINMNKITGVEGNLIQLQDMEVSISRSLKETVLEKILHNKLLKK